jgi:hypothetical protein
MAIFNMASCSWHSTSSSGRRPGQIGSPTPRTGRNRPDLLFRNCCQAGMICAGFRPSCSMSTNSTSACPSRASRNHFNGRHRAGRHHSPHPRRSSSTPSAKAAPVPRTAFDGRSVGAASKRSSTSSRGPEGLQHARRPRYATPIAADHGSPHAVSLWEGSCGGHRVGNRSDVFGGLLALGAGEICNSTAGSLLLVVLLHATANLPITVLLGPLAIDAARASASTPSSAVSGCGHYRGIAGICSAASQPEPRRHSSVGMRRALSRCWFPLRRSGNRRRASGRNESEERWALTAR